MRVNDHQSQALVLRRPDVPEQRRGCGVPGRARTWFHTDTKQFHLDMDAAKNLIPLATYLWRPLWMVTRSFRSSFYI